ncbi:hypothetical protein BN903_93 [Halorubrum sp. AJ67]|nr:hypothetical protein BN903_93 [Halorubrum sp. AJ67]
MDERCRDHLGTVLIVYREELGWPDTGKTAGLPASRHRCWSVQTDETVGISRCRSPEGIQTIHEYPRKLEFRTELPKRSLERSVARNYKTRPKSTLKQSSEHRS